MEFGLFKDIVIILAGVFIIGWNIVDGNSVPGIVAATAYVFSQ